MEDSADTVTLQQKGADRINKANEKCEDVLEMLPWVRDTQIL